MRFRFCRCYLTPVGNVMKQGYKKAKEMNDEQALENARNYRSMLIPKDLFPIIRYRTDRGEDYGVLVNMGENVIIWNAFKESLEHYTIAEYHQKYIGAAE